MVEIPNALSPVIQVGTYAAICRTIYWFAEKGDGLISDETKLELKGRILNLKTPETMRNWPMLFAHWFDRVFGEKHLSWQCFFRSCLASLAAVLLVTLVWAALRFDELGFVLSGFWNAPSKLELLQGILLYFLALNLLPDYASLLETRYIIKLMGNSNSLALHTMLLALDAIVTLLIAVALPLFLALFSFSIVAAEPISLPAYLYEVLPLTGKSQLLGSTAAPFLSICFYTSFLTSVWIWLYAAAGFLLKVLTLWDFAKSKVKLDEKPLTYLGAMAVVIVTVVRLLLWVLPVSGDGAQSGHKDLCKLRSTGKVLSIEKVKKMIGDFDYFDADWNVRGQGIENNFVKLLGDSVVYDSTTCLFWQRSGSSEFLTIEGAEAYIDSLNRTEYAGHSNWRLPTLEEAVSLMEPKKNENDLFIKPVFDKIQRWIWTSDKSPASRPWGVGFGGGGCGYGNVYGYYFVRAVR